MDFVQKNCEYKAPKMAISSTGRWNAFRAVSARHPVGVTHWTPPRQEHADPHRHSLRSINSDLRQEWPTHKDRVCLKNYILAIVAEHHRVLNITCTSTQRRSGLAWRPRITSVCVERGVGCEYDPHIAFRFAPRSAISIRYELGKLRVKTPRYTKGAPL